MDSYIKKLQTLQQELIKNVNNNTKIINKNEKYLNLKKILLYIMSSNLLAFIITYMETGYTGLMYMMLAIEFPSIVFFDILRNKVKSNDKKYDVLNIKSNNLIKDIENVLYFNLEKQRNNVINENKNNKLVAIEKQKELLMDYKNKINGIYNGDIPKEIDKEIEYLNDKIYTYKKCK